MYLFKFFLFVTLFIALLSGCGMSAEEEIFSHLENAVGLEADFEKQQQPLVELEKREQTIYEKIIKLGMSEFEQIQRLSKEAIEVVNERETRIEKEKESIESSKEEFLLTESRVAKLKDEKVKNNAEDLLKVMNLRYDSYDKLYKNYKSAIALDRELYEMFQKEELTLEQLEVQVKKINEMYDNVVKENEKFNELTDTYNKKKKEFYLAADLNVVFDNTAR